MNSCEQKLMIKANLADKEHIVDILTRSFDNNKSVNYIVKQDRKRKERIMQLMRYSFDICYSFGKVFLSDNRQGCALILLPEKKKTTFQTLWGDIKLIFTCTGLGNLKRALDREAKIKSLQPKEPFYYLWFIGVHPDEQGKGIGSALLKEILAECGFKKRIICLETSTTRNISWYEKFGFVIYDRLDLGYELLFMKKNN